MNTQVIFKLDSEIKNQAMKKAQKEGIPFAAVLKLATKAYIMGDLEIKLTPNEQLKAAAKKKLEKSLQDIKNKKNLSDAFDSAEDAIQFLKSM